MIYHEAAVVDAMRDFYREAGRQTSKNCVVEASNAILTGSENLTTQQNGEHRLRCHRGHHDRYVPSVRSIDEALHDRGGQRVGILPLCGEWTSETERPRSQRCGHGDTHEPSVVQLIERDAECQVGAGNQASPAAHLPDAAVELRPSSVVTGRVVPVNCPEALLFLIHWILA